MSESIYTATTQSESKPVPASNAGDSINLSDTSAWLPLDGLAPGFDASKAPTSQALAGQSVVLINDDGDRHIYDFAADSVTSSGPDSADSLTQACEVFEVADGLYYAEFHGADRADQATSLILDLSGGRGLLITSTLGDAAPGHTAVQQDFAPLTIEGAENPSEIPAPTTELIGRRALWVYSSEHAYEHVYLSPHWYSWQCLAGPEQGLADTDENSVWRIRPGIYVFTWREKVIPCGSVTIADHRDIKSLRSHGMLFGADESGSGSTHFTFGAYGRLLSNTVHPVEYDPARGLAR